MTEITITRRERYGRELGTSCEADPSRLVTPQAVIPREKGRR